MDFERAELLDAAGRYHQRMYDQLCAEVLAAVRELFEERAAIMQFDGGLPRAEAERLAWLDVGGGWPLAADENPAARTRAA